MNQGFKFFIGLFIVWSLSGCQPGWESKLTNTSDPQRLTGQPDPKPPVGPASPSGSNSEDNDATPVPAPGSGQGQASGHSSGDVSSPDQLCVRSLCDNSDPMPHPFDVSEQAQGAAWKTVEAKVKKPLFNYMGRLIHKTLVQDDLFKKLFAKQEKVTFSAEKTGLLQSIWYNNRLPMYLPAVVPDKEGQAVFDIEKLKKIIGPKNTNEIEAVSKLIDVIRFQQNYKRYLESQPFEVVLRFFYSDLSLVDAQKREASVILSILQDLQALVPELEFIRPEDFVLKKALAGEALSFTEKNIFKREMRERLVLGYLMQPQVQAAFQRIPVDVPKLLESTKKTYLASRQAKSVANPKGFKKLLQDAVQTCATKLSYSYAALPSQSQLDQFQNLFQTIQKGAQALIEEKKQGSLTQSLNVELILPAAREKAIESWAVALQEAVTASDSNLKKMKSIDLTNGQNLQSMFIIAALFTDREIFEDIFEFCDQAHVPDRDDATLRGMNLIHLSWATVVHPSEGAGVAAHELGHIVSEKWPELVKREKQCLEQKQGTEKYAEEDFADLFAAELLKRTKEVTSKSQTKSGFACSLLSRNEKDWEPVSIANPDKQDSHSSGFYRLMAISGHLGQSTLACQEYLNSVQESRFQNYCRWEK